jgi:aerobic carbon-monoxide dehydrogenase large subunit
MTEIGAHRKRVEDPPLLRGQGQYVEDLRLPGTVDVAFVRSTHPHARITRIDLEEARAAPGVLAVWSGEQVRHVPRVPVRIRMAELHASPLPALAQDVVTMVGYPVVAVVATDRSLARDAAELVQVEYEPLDPITDPEHALDSASPRLFPELGTNLGYRMHKEGGDVDAALARANRRVSLRVQHSRLAPVPMEPRGILASFDRAEDRLTIWRSTQSPFGTRTMLAAVLERPEASIRVIAPDVGGAFGAKTALYPDELTTVLLALELGLPVRWVSTRIEDLQLTVQGRDIVNHVDAGFTGEGIVTALSVRSVHNLGGVLMHPVATPPMRVVDYATGAYRIPAFRAEAFGVYTNTAPTGPYRGAGRPEAAMVAERTIEAVAHELGLDPITVRRRNLLKPDEFPYTTPVGSVYDSGRYEVVMDRMLEVLGYADVLGRQHQAREQRDGSLLGIGIATTIEVSAQGNEYGSVEVEPDGSIVARTGSSSHGQGHETSFAQVVADALEVPIERVRVLHGDTEQTPTGGGTAGSRSMALGGGALAVSSTSLKKRALEVAAGLLEVSVEDLVFARGGVEVLGVPERRAELSELVPAAGGHLLVEETFAAPESAVPFGASAAVVQVDPETGHVHLERLVVVDDCGTVVNPLIVHGQVAGSLAQGVAEALYERVVFAEGGELLSSSLLDYAVPKAAMLPDFELDMISTPSPNNPLGAKGIGEAGCVSAPPAILNAVLDALRPLGVESLTMPLTSERVWQAIQSTARYRTPR